MSAETHKVVCFSCNSILRAPAGRTGRAKCPRCKNYVDLGEEPATEPQEQPEPVATAERVETPKPNRQLVIVVAAIASLFVGLLFFVVLVLLLRSIPAPEIAETTKKQAIPAPPPKAEAKPPAVEKRPEVKPQPQTEWECTAPNIAVQINMATISVIAMNVKDVEYDVIMVGLYITPDNDTKKLDIIPWRYSRSICLTDEFGNVYKQAANMPPNPLRSVTGSATCDKPFIDVIYFEPPIPKATALKLVLPLENMGVTGKLICNFPKETWQEKK